MKGIKCITGDSVAKYRDVIVGPTQPCMALVTSADLCESQTEKADFVNRVNPLR